MSKRVFISYTKADRGTAYQICKGLEERGIECWIAPRDIRPGESDWADPIVRAIEEACGFVLVLSKATSSSNQVKREVHLASSADLRIVPVKIEQFSDIGGVLAYHIGARQHLSAFAGPIENYLDQLADALGEQSSDERHPPPPQPEPPWWHHITSRRSLLVAGGFLLLTAAALSPYIQGLLSQWFRGGTITIQGKLFMESSILVELMAIVIEEEGDGDIEVNREHWRDENEVLFLNLRHGYSDLVPDYSGTLLVQHLKMDYEDARKGNHRDNDWIRKKLDESKYGDKLQWLDGFGYKSNYALVMLRSQAEELNLSSISDLEDVAKGLRIGTEQKFTTRKDGWEGLLRTYPGLHGLVRLDFPHERKFEGLRLGHIHVAAAYTTDPELDDVENSPYVKLIDDQRFFIDYYAAPLARRAMLDDYPEVVNALGKLAGKITSDDMVGWIEEVEAAGINGEKLNINPTMRHRLRELCRDFLKKKILPAPP